MNTVDARLARRLGVRPEALERARVALNRIAALPTAEQLPLLLRVTRGSGVAERTCAGLLSVLPAASGEALLAAPAFGDKRLAAVVTALEGFAALDDVLKAAEAPAQIASLEARLARQALEKDDAIRERDAARVLAADAIRERDAARVLAADATRERDAARVVAADAIQARDAAVRDATKAGGIRDADTTAAPAPAQAMVLDALARSVGQQLGAVQRAMTSHPVRLGPVSVTLRGVAVAVGEQVGLQFKSLASRQGLERTDEFGREAPAASEVKFSFVPSRRPSPVLPDVRGYSALLAQRKLVELGASVVVSGQAGVVRAQDPAAGTLVEPGMQVTITLAG
jgi:hypothetical protein